MKLRLKSICIKQGSDTQIKRVMKTCVYKCFADCNFKTPFYRPHTARKQNETIVSRKHKT